jgi:trimethyllysine dioxygenase
MLLPSFIVSKATFDDEQVSIHFSDGQVAKFHHIWLRDLCQCETDFHPQTKQRLLNTFEIPEDIKPASVEVASANGPAIKVTWATTDNHISEFPVDWLVLHSYNPVLVADKTKRIERSLWNAAEIKQNWPAVEYSDVMAKESAVGEWARKIFVHGFCMVDNVPATPEDTEKLIERLSYIKPTHYGGFWDFTADLAKNDTAYTNLTLASHTDGTYWSDTPGLQLFHMLYHDGTGGENMLVDGFKAAEALKAQSPEAYDILSRTLIPAHSAGEEDVCITPTMPLPVFTHHNQTGELVQVRWNNCDRSVMDQWKDPADVVKFYKAIRLWNALLTSPEYEIQVKLKPDECLIFDNWRVLHGRLGFDGNRRMCGAYVNRDDFISRVRLLNLGRDEVIKNL